MNHGDRFRINIPIEKYLMSQMKEKYLFFEQDFISHSGNELHWKIECDAIFT